MSTGDELVEDGSPLRPGQIRESNRTMLLRLVAEAGAEPVDLGIIPDDESVLESALRSAVTHENLDAVVTSGGVSMGEKDHLPKVLADMGATLLFHRIDLRPGKPMLVALLGNLLVLGLPGNPVSSYVNARLFLEVALARLQGRPWPEPWHEAVLRGAVSNAGSRPLLHPCALRDGGLEPLRSQGSADLAALARSGRHGRLVWRKPGGRSDTQQPGSGPRELHNGDRLGHV